jgi:hypothetical protein
MLQKLNTVYKSHPLAPIRKKSGAQNERNHRARLGAIGVLADSHRFLKGVRENGLRCKLPSVLKSPSEIRGRFEISDRG